VQARSPAYHQPVLVFLRDRLNRPMVAIVAVGLFAGVLRFTHLDYPETRIFDEYYYPKSACIFLGYSNARCDINSSAERYWRTARDDTGAWVHPPLGKWMIAAGELAYGTRSFGWRVSAAVTGTLSVVALAIVVQLLFGSPIWTFVAGLLLATENLNFVQSRTSMLDIFVTFWIVVGFLLLLLDRRWIDRRTADPGRTSEAESATVQDIDRPVATSDGAGWRFPQPLWRPWRFAAGVAFGCAFATKWSGITAIMGAVVLAFAWEVVRRKGRQISHPFWSTLQIETFGLVLAFLAVPALVYVVSYAGWFFHFGFHLGEWANMQGAIASYQKHLTSIDPVTHQPIHPYLAQAWKWILLWRPVLYYTASPSPGVRQVIYANGNPAIFWGAILSVPYAAFAWWRARDWRAGFVVVAVLFLYVPWFFVSRPEFFFYATPITPFFVLACVYAVRELSEMRVPGATARPYLPVAVAFVIVSVGLFIFFWPVMTGAPITDAAFKLRTWFPSWV
jgi:dolichyl-phosphate-mannose-protein mannosyltransferase